LRAVSNMRKPSILMSVVPEEFRVRLSRILTLITSMLLTYLSFAILLGKVRLTGNVACHKRNSVKYWQMQCIADKDTFKHKWYEMWTSELWLHTLTENIYIWCISSCIRSRGNLNKSGKEQHWLGNSFNNKCKGKSYTEMNTVWQIFLQRKYLETIHIT